MNEVLLVLLGALVWFGFRAFFRYFDVRDSQTQVLGELSRVTTPVRPLATAEGSAAARPLTGERLA